MTFCEFINYNLFLKFQKEQKLFLLHMKDLLGLPAHCFITNMMHILNKHERSYGLNLR